jgi:hypothetical protein
MVSILGRMTEALVFKARLKLSRLFRTVIVAVAAAMAFLACGVYLLAALYQFLMPHLGAAGANLALAAFFAALGIVFMLATKAARS